MKIHEFIEVNPTEIKKFEAAASVANEIESVSDIFAQIGEVCGGDEQLKKHYDEVVESCYNYTAIVCEYERIGDDFKQGRIDYDEFGEKLDLLESRRSAVHNSTIDCFNILSRLMAKNNLDNSWIAPLRSGGRVAYGNFAIKKTLSDVLKYNKEK